MLVLLYLLYKRQLGATLFLFFSEQHQVVGHHFIVVGLFCNALAELILVCLHIAYVHLAYCHRPVVYDVRHHDIAYHELLLEDIALSLVAAHQQSFALQ